MALVEGLIMNMDPLFIWMVQRKKNATSIWQSTDFFTSELNCTFCFRLKPDGSLYLCHLGDASLSLNLRIILKYYHESRRTFIVERLKTKSVVPPYSEYLLGIIDEPDDIQALSCEFINRNKMIDDEESFSLSKDLHDLFLSKEDSDVVLKIGDHRYPVHKAIIKARSPVFHAMLKRDMIEKNKGVITISDCDPQIFPDFLLYLYSGRLDNISMDNVFDFFQISEKFGVTEMKDGLVDFIKKDISVDAFCETLSFAMKHNEDELLGIALEFFGNFAKDIVSSEKWQKLIVDNPPQAHEFLKKVFQHVKQIIFKNKMEDQPEYYMMLEDHPMYSRLLSQTV